MTTPNTEQQNDQLDLARLQRELPLMRKENQRLTGFLQDAAAFIRIANSGKGRGTATSFWQPLSMT